MKKTILLADDDTDDQQLLSEALDQINEEFSLHAVSSAKEAMNYLLAGVAPRPDLIILDYNMPDSNGAQVLDMIKSHDEIKQIPVLVWSTSDSDIYKKICEEKGASAYFQKPSSYKGLLDIIREMISFAS